MNNHPAPVTVTAVTIPTPDGVTYYPWSDGYAVGFRAVRADGPTEFVYINPSGDTDDGQPNVVIYHGTGSPSTDLPVCHIDVLTPDAATEGQPRCA